MFDSPGSKLKTVAKILFWFNLVLCVIFAFTLGIDRKNYGTYVEKDVNIWAFIYFLVLGPVLSYILSLILYGFGELIENSTMYGVIKAVNNLNESNKQELPDQKAISPSALEDNLARNNNLIPEGHVQCPRCKRIQAAGRPFCFECGFGGAPFGTGLNT